eukprot:686682-Prorocentrum_minimum.AAC.1
MLSGCCLDVVRMLSRCCPDVVLMLSGCCPDVVRMLSRCCPDVARRAAAGIWAVGSALVVSVGSLSQRLSFPLQH